MNLYDDTGNLIAWTHRGNHCSAVRCKIANADGRWWHIIPAHTDPRARTVHLVMPEYHFRTIEEAAHALEAAWDKAETVTTSEARDLALSRGEPVKVVRR